MAWVDSITNKMDTFNKKNKRSQSDSWSWPPVEPGKLNCILCEKVISFFNGNTKEFFTHIETEHKVFINQWLLLSIIFLDNGTLDEIRDKFRDNMNALKVTGPAGLEDSFVDDDNDASDNDSFGEDSDGFDEEDIFDGLTKEAFNDDNQSKSKAHVTSSKDEILENANVAKYKPGPKSYKMKQLLKNHEEDQDGMLLNQNHNLTTENDGEKHPKQKETKNILATLNAKSKGQLTIQKSKQSNENSHLANHILDGEIYQTSSEANLGIENKTYESIVTSNITHQTEAENLVTKQENRFSKLSSLVHSALKDQFKSDDTLPPKLNSLVPSAQKDQFKQDDTLPPNWTSRKTYRENKKSFDTDFMSPDGRKVRSRVMVVEYMKQMGIYTEMDYENVISKKTFNMPKDDVISYKPGPKSRKNKQKWKTLNNDGIIDTNNDVLKIQREMEDDMNMPESLLKEDVHDDNFEGFGESGSIDGKNNLDYNPIDDDWSKHEDLFDIGNGMLSGLKRKSNDSELAESFHLKRQKIIEPKSNMNNGIMVDELKNMLESYDFDENIDMRSDPKTIYNLPLPTKPKNHSAESLSIAEQIKSMLEDDFDEDESEPLSSTLDADDDAIERMANKLMDEEIKNLQDYEPGSSKFDNSIKMFANELEEEDIKNMRDFDIFNENVDMEAKEKSLKRSVKNKSRKKLHKDKQSLKSVTEVATEPNFEDIHSEMSLKIKNPKSKKGINKDIGRYEEMVSEPIEGGEYEKSEGFQHAGAKYPIDVKISEYFCKRPNQLSGYNISQTLKDQFVDDESLPFGWKIKKTWRQNKKNYDIEYLSPDGRKARSKVAVIEYMKLLGYYTQKDDSESYSVQEAKRIKRGRNSAKYELEEKPFGCDGTCLSQHTQNSVVVLLEVGCKYCLRLEPERSL